ncbi:AraC family transcriptional regulator [Pedobacter frigoris]|uniref:AraC family transcriptional regulator n=1 Tax=Pedobacter frigoris TaxID=2571272 RepID=A0A4U1CLE9_9SPHI|nr:AraC family transcriptional regulator [Pedobacter frigoris]TKC08627.1 AraC family transcriptional regulator [Pedobacter frigoris]
MKVFPFTVLLPDDKSFIIQQVNAPHFYPYLHRHEEYQITWVEEGEGTLIIGNCMHAFKSGDIFFIGTNLPHLFKSNSESFNIRTGTGAKGYIVFFNLNGKLAPLFNLPEMKELKSFIVQNSHGFKLPAKYNRSVSGKLVDIYASPPTKTDTLFKFLELLNELSGIRNIVPLCSPVYSPAISENEGVRLRNILNFIMQNYNTPITLENVSDVAYMTPQAFCRYFKKHTGRKFISFLNEVRINEACKSLVAGNKGHNISGVAYGAGFSSITNFNRVFKSVIGSSPKDYINTYNKVNNSPMLSI